MKSAKVETTDDFGADRRRKLEMYANDESRWVEITLSEAFTNEAPMRPLRIDVTVSDLLAMIRAVEAVMPKEQGNE
jgi:hypothetical protein